MLQLSSKWAEFFNNQAETGMGYVITTVVLKDGRRYPRVPVIGGCIGEINGEPTIPFHEDDIAEFVITHDKTDLLRRPR
ncbi:MAG: hypothetical protein JSR24_09715 [Proteobacteria bacterium]|nr:hypothetical protein [Pseudomonadota bacterium]